MVAIATRRSGRSVRYILPLLFLVATPALASLLIPQARAASAECERLAQTAEQLLRAESTSPGLRTQRIAAFHSAAQRLAQEIDTVPPGSPPHLVLMFRLALYLYLADEAADAQILLAECQQHPQLAAPTAMWNGESIRAQLRKFSGVRIYASSDTEGATFAPHTPFEGARLSAHSSKGGITHEPPPAPNEPYTAAELASLRARVATTRFPDQALSVGSKLMAKLPELVSVQREGLTLIGSGDAANAAILADALVAARQELWKQIMGRSDTPPRLMTYANLHAENSEQLGAEISSAVHFRESSGREGYYCPLDRSLVLRKGIVASRGKLFLGTALHEVTHALIHADFPTAPHFLDEGIAALHEERNPSGAPRDNYRLYWLLQSLATSPKLSLTTELREGTPKNPVLRDAIARYTAMLLYEAEPQGAALHRYYRRLRDGKNLDAVAELQRTLKLPTSEALDARFVEFVRARDVSVVDERWYELKPRILRMNEPARPLGPGGSHGPMQIPTGGERRFPGPRGTPRLEQRPSLGQVAN